MGLPGSPSNASNASNCAASVFEISDDESESDTSLTSLTQLLEEWMDEEMASIEKEQAERRQVDGGSLGDLRSGEISQGQGPVSKEAPAKAQTAQQSYGEDLASLPWETLWRKLEAQGWRMEHGPRGKGRQAYYLPPGVKRGPGKKNRVDYFDSKKLVLQLLSCGEGSQKQRQNSTAALQHSENGGGSTKFMRDEAAGWRTATQAKPKTWR
ncbi:unnamed protein product [Symbiodinium sp. CCMP2592]|nr:unnamed protein product [Symbiodinium sp. CCMP2592]